MFNYLLHREGNVVERETLLRDVWGSTYVGSNVVEAVIRSLRKKLGDRAPAIETVRGLGYRSRLEKGRPPTGGSRRIGGGLLVSAVCCSSNRNT